MSDGINVEVIGKYKERYPAKIHAFTGENDVIIKFNDSPNVLCKVPMTSLLLSLDSSYESKPSDYQVGCDVLVLRKLDDSITSSFQFNDIKLSQAFWPAKIEKLKGGFAAVQFISKENDICNEIVELSTLRLISDRRPLLKSDIHIHEMIVPDDLCEFCENYDIRGDLNKWCGSAIVVNFDKINKRLQIFSTDKEVVRKASLLDASFMRLLRQKKLVHSQKDELTKRLHDSVRNQFTEEVTVSDDLMGLAIGHQGCNIKKARELEGIISIELNDYTHTFAISAQTQEACKAARALLEYQQKVLYVPMDIVSKVIGKSGNQIQDLINQSGINRVKVVEGPDRQNWIDEEKKHLLEDHVPFIFSGSAGSLGDAEFLLEFSIANHREMDQLQKERDEIQREIRNSQVPTNVTSKVTNNNVYDREDDYFNNWSSRGHNSGPRNRGRGNYKNATNSDNDQRNDSYNDDLALNQQKYRGNGRPGQSRRGSGSFRNAAPAPLHDGQHNGNRRYQQYDDDTEDYAPSATVTDIENGRGGGNSKYRGNKNRPNRGSRSNNSNGKAKSASATETDHPQYRNGDTVNADDQAIGQ